MRARRPSSPAGPGDTLSDDDCIVTHSQSAPWIKGDSFFARHRHGAGLPELQRHRGDRQGSRKLGGQPGGAGPPLRQRRSSSKRISPAAQADSAHFRPASRPLIPVG